MAEWRWILIYAIVLTALTAIPYLIAWQAAGDQWEFNGFTFGVEDGNAYLGKMKIGADGGWKFYLFFTPESHENAFGLYLPYILIGHLVRLIINPSQPELPTILAITFQILRIFSDVILILVIYRFIAQFVGSRQGRWFALLIATIGGGLGWLLILVGQDNFLGTAPVDFYIPEGFSFLVIYGLPHIALARALILLGFIFFFRKDGRGALLAGLCWSGVGLLVTFYLALIYALMGVWGAMLWLQSGRLSLDFIRRGGIAVGITLPLFFYNVWLFQSNEAFAQWSKQNYLPSPHPLHYLIGYGVLAFCAVGGIRWAWRRSNGEPYALLIGWVLIVPVLVYLPINVQRRLAEAVLIPLAILAGVGIRLSRTWLTRKVKRTQTIILVLLLPSTVLFWLVGVFNMINPSKPAFRPQNELAALDWLADHAKAGEVVLSPHDIGNYLPIRTNLRPFVGHGPETLYSEQKRDLLDRFFRGDLTSQEQRDLFEQFHIRYVIWDGENPPVEIDTLHMIYSDDGYTIYEVVDESP